MLTHASLAAALGLAAQPAAAGETPAAATIREAQNARNLKTVTRLRSLAVCLIDTYAPGAPDQVKCEAVIRTAGYLRACDGTAAILQQFQVTGGAGGGVDLRFRSAAQSALRASGAAAILSPWRVRRALRAVAS